MFIMSHSPLNFDGRLGCPMDSDEYGVASVGGCAVRIDVTSRDNVVADDDVLLFLSFCLGSSC